jgi:hypothetical protein
MWIGFRCFAIIPYFSFIFGEFAQNGNQRFDGDGATIGANLTARCDGDLENLSGFGHNLECDCNDQDRRSEANEARHVLHDLTTKLSGGGRGRLSTWNQLMTRRPLQRLVRLRIVFERFSLVFGLHDQHIRRTTIFVSLKFVISRSSVRIRLPAPSILVCAAVKYAGY